MPATIYNNAPTDEYGLEKPADFWMKKAADWMCPPEVMNDPNRQGEAVARGFGAVPALFGGYVMDELSPIDSNGSLRMPVPMLGLIADGAEQSRYQQERAEAEARAREAAGDGETDVDPGPATPEYGPTVDPPSSEDDNQCSEPNQSGGDDQTCAPYDGQY